MNSCSFRLLPIVKATVMILLSANNSLYAQPSQSDGSESPSGSAESVVVKKVHELNWRDLNVNGMDVSPDGKLVAAKFTSWYVIWEVATGRQVQAINDHPNGYHTVRFIDGGQQIVGSRPTSVGFWNVSDGRLTRTVPLQLQQFAYSPNEQFIATSQVGVPTVSVKNLKTDRTVQLVGHPRAPGVMAFSPNGRLLATGGVLAQSTIVWDLVSGKKLPLEYMSVDPQFSPDGMQLAITTTQDALILYDFKTRNSMHTIDDAGAGTVAYSPDGRMIATGGRGKTDPLRFWNSQTGERLKAATTEIGPCNHLKFTPDGRTLVAAPPGPKINILSIALESE